MSVSTEADIAGIAPGTPVVGKIFADYCGYCTQMAPAWAEMIANPRVTDAGVAVLNIQKDNANPKTNADAIVAAINARLVTSGPKLTYSTVPRIFKIREGSVSYHEGGRDAAALSNFAASGLKEAAAAAAAAAASRNRRAKTVAARPAWHGGSRRRRARFSRRRPRRQFRPSVRFGRVPRYTRRHRPHHINYSNARTSAWKYSGDE
jgi:hypothetical protein